MNEFDKNKDEREDAELEKDRKKWTIRRRMAVSSLCSLIAFAVYYSAIGLLITAEQAKNISEFNGIVISIIGSLASLLLGYFGTAYFDDQAARNSSKNNDKSL